MEDKRFMFCRNCLRFWKTTSEKKFVSCICNSRTSIDMTDINDLFKKVHGLNCYKCRNTWFSRAKGKYIKCGKCGKNVRQVIGSREFIKYFRNTGIDGLKKLLLNFPNISKRGFIILSMRLHPSISFEDNEVLNFWADRKKINPKIK